MITYLKQDITKLDMGIICHGVNCQHAMGSGVAGAIKKKWPIVYEHFMGQPRGVNMLGVVSMVPIYENDSLFIANCYTQNFYGYGGGKYANLDAIRRSMSQVLMSGDYYSLPVYMPKIGCGLGGLDWETEVEPVIISLNTFFDRVNLFVCELGE
jgi:O-acetyl-ADP-ribose deacetylase (regulator of RNase III)